MRGSEFAELKAFAAVVERASFARAAEHLGLSPSALSQTIRQLEARLGARLLNRTTRSVAPTATGEHLYGRIAPLFREMADAVAEASAAAAQTSGTLRINTLGMAARQVIAPRLGRFHRAYPDVALDIVVDDGLSDIVAGRFDAGCGLGVACAARLGLGVQQPSLLQGLGQCLCGSWCSGQYEGQQPSRESARSSVSQGV